MGSLANFRHLPTSIRSIRMENRSALFRRWQLMTSSSLTDPRLEKRLFPNQRDLLQMLQVMTEPEVEKMAECGTPLFCIQFRPTEFSLDACAHYPVSSPMEEAACDESFLALTARLDSIRTSFQQACLMFNLGRNEAAWLSSFCPQELRLLARDPAMVLVPAVNFAYFVASTTRTLTAVERTMLGSIARGRTAVMQ